MISAATKTEKLLSRLKSTAATKTSENVFGVPESQARHEPATNT